MGIGPKLQNLMLQLFPNSTDFVSLKITEMFIVKLENRAPHLYENTSYIFLFICDNQFKKIIYKQPKTNKNVCLYDSPSCKASEFHIIVCIINLNVKCIILFQPESKNKGVQKNANAILREITVPAVTKYQVTESAFAH